MSNCVSVGYLSHGRAVRTKCNIPVAPVTMADDMVVILDGEL